MSMQPWEEAYESSRDADRLRKENEHLRTIADAMYRYLEIAEQRGAVNEGIMSLNSYHPLAECLKRWASAKLVYGQTSP